MDTRQNRLLVRPDTMSEQDLIQQIGNTRPLAPQQSYRKRLSFCDTFDWRLFQKGFVLEQTGSEYRFRAMADTVSAVAEEGSPTARFWWDFPDGPLQRALKPILGVRALIRLATIVMAVRPFCVLNEDEKTVARLFWEDVHLIRGRRKEPLYSAIVVAEVRGYTAEFGTLVQGLHAQGVSEPTQDAFHTALHAVGRSPGDYTSKLVLDLPPDASGRQAAAVILKHLLNTMQQNVGGILADIDAEFLHDFRVAVRRTRSVLSQVKGVFPKAELQRFRQEFSALGKLTNRPRDLDVYLLNKDDYKAMLPGSLRQNLDPLFGQLARERVGTYQKLGQALKGAAYRRLVADWESFLNATDEALGPSKHAQMPALDLALRFIRKQYRKVIKLGRAIDDATPDSALHDLRIECKKLRYLLEFFASLFSAKDIGNLVSQLKKLQDNLGDFNDLCVQQADLGRYLETGVPGRENVPLTAAAVGGLIGTLYRKQQTVRGTFSATFKAFAGRETGFLFQSVFETPTSVREDRT